jgi:hypothetical protein
MITIKVDEDTLLEMLLDRVQFWTSDETTIDLYRDYYEGLVNSGCFEGCELDIMAIVDNDYVNNLTTISKEDFEQWDIESEVDDSIVAFNEEEDLYLIRTY